MPLTRLAPAALLASACATTTATTAPAVVAHDPVFDRNSILQADRDFDLETSVHGVEGWLAAFEDGSTQWNHGQIIHGKEHYRETMPALLSKPGQQLRWEPVWAEVDGDLGYTTGKWQLHQIGPDGKDAVTATGHYVTVWKRQPDGRWKAAFDMGNEEK